MFLLFYNFWSLSNLFGCIACFDCSVNIWKVIKKYILIFRRRVLLYGLQPGVSRSQSTQQTHENESRELFRWFEEEICVYIMRVFDW